MSLPPRPSRIHMARSLRSSKGHMVSPSRSPKGRMASCGSSRGHKASSRGRQGLTWSTFPVVKGSHSQPSRSLRGHKAGLLRSEGSYTKAAVLDKTPECLHRI
ncbi:hypothetical protein Hamer_G001719 [Homarus americanus]|uniref:Uncharacterized protein n=1 Tax=Homarus americanus TaxID=6706 RepID=A0A8J5MQV0_HOMAM|nr:hypothetical protein Hamer_G001719 [Homarus americanus]